jgi:NAD(P)-dependent dehydrogenase (short-subunit alcohol dehydrogenase family)
MDLDLTDRVYLVTGGARGLGRATADCLVADGARVVLSGRSEESLREAVAELGDRAAVAVMAISNGLRPGLAMVAKTLADELGPRGVRVNGLLPGRVDTERLAELDAASDDPEQARAAALASIPLGRYGEPEEFGRAAAFLLSPAASFVSGAMLPVDGGMLRAL